MFALWDGSEPYPQRYLAVNQVLGLFQLSQSSDQCRGVWGRQSNHRWLIAIKPNVCRGVRKTAVKFLITHRMVGNSEGRMEPFVWGLLV